jgi:hypothetical protein
LTRIPICRALVFLAGLCLQLQAAPLTAQAADYETLVVAPAAEIRLESTEPEVQVEVAWDGGLLTPSPAVVRAPEDGDHWLVVASRDAAGNISPVRWIRLRVDGEPPIVELAIEPEPVDGDDGRRWVPADTRVSASARDALSPVVELGLDPGSGEAMLGVADATASLPPEGDLAVRAWASDSLGNRSQDLIAKVSVDPWPPTGSLDFSGPQAEVEGELVVNGEVIVTAALEDQGSGLATWTPRLDGEEVDESAWRAPWEPGEHRVDATAMDRVGNRAVLEEVTFTVDVEAPAISWSVRNAARRGCEERVYHVPPVAVVVEAADDRAGVERLEWRTGESEWTPAEGLVETDAPSLSLRATDRVGNVSLEEASWGLDTEAPEIAFVAPGGDLASGATVTLGVGESATLRASDDSCRVVSVRHRLLRRLWWREDRYVVQREPWIDSSGAILFDEDGAFLLEAEALDPFGKRTYAEWLIDVGEAAP